LITAKQALQKAIELHPNSTSAKDMLHAIENPEEVEDEEDSEDDSMDEEILKQYMAGGDDDDDMHALDTEGTQIIRSLHKRK
jgi:hypothetical protein